MRTRVSQGCFLVGIILVILQDLKGLASISSGYSLPWAIMFYTGLILIAAGYVLK